MTQQGYAHPELLAETEWLAEHLGDPRLRIVDCDPPDAYRRVHIPGAVNVGENSYIKGEDKVHVMPPEPLAAFMGSLGIGDNTLVVAYDSRDSLLAARLWWVLSYYGHPNVKVLNGGWRKWLAEGRPMVDTVPDLPKATFTPKPDPSLIVTGEALRALVGDSNPVIWDVRSPEEYTGENSRANKYGGHIPGAAHLEWSGVMNSEGLGTFKPASQVRAMLQEKGITRDREVYTY